MINDQTLQRFQRAKAATTSQRTRLTRVAGAELLDAGIETRGSLQAGILLAELCLADRAAITVTSCDPTNFVTDQAVRVQTDDPLTACLGAQYAGWPIQCDDFFAMGSGPMRLLRGKEEVLKELGLTDSGDHVVGILESDKPPTEAAIAMIAQQCGVDPAGIHLAIAPSTSIAGSVQVVARSIETAMHKLHELKFDVRTIVSAVGFAPLPPPAKPGDTVDGIGRTNDAILYGGRVTLWVDCDDDAIDAVADQVPSHSSSDHGQPFAKVFKQYDYDFYQVDPLLFSPAVVTFHSLRTGRTWTRGETALDVLRESFLT
ncbi:MAG: methenyltetrahydromethanopterin cyclohydrolase, partial [Pirellulaceae bacterium]|nr:methenyltetrahydromethanopterin cyclohydrolase [Pirellulaceae bacterium]